jgi:hypothetical protein
MTPSSTFLDLTPEALQDLADALGTRLLEVESTNMFDDARLGNDEGWLRLSYDKREEVLYSALVRARDGQQVELTWLAKASGLTVELPPVAVGEHLVPLTSWWRRRLAPVLLGDFQEFDALVDAQLRLRVGAAFKTAVPLPTPLALDRAEELGADVARLLQPFAFLGAVGFHIAAMRREGNTLLVYLGGPQVDFEVRTGDAERAEKVEAQLVQHESGARLSVSWLRLLETDRLAASELPVRVVAELLEKEVAILDGDMRRFDEACAMRDRYGRNHGMTFSA